MPPDAPLLPPGGGEVVVSALTWRPYARRAPVFRDLSLTIPAGQRVLLVGPSGAGKSTLLRALGGLLLSDGSGELSGTVTIDGHRAGQRAGEVGLVLQEPGAGVVAATVSRDVAFGPENIGMPPEEMPAVVQRALSSVRLEVAGDTSTNALSGGQTQRLALAGALALSPRVLLLDEPTAMLDEANAAAVRSAVADVTSAYAMTTVVVEHLLEPWVSFADRVVALGATGEVIADGEPDDVFASVGRELADAGVWVPGHRVPDLVVPPEGSVVLHGGSVPRGGSVRRGGSLRRGGSVPRGDSASTAPVWATDVVVERHTQQVGGSVTVVRALEGFSAAGHPGRSTALVGPSGSGKSTALLTMAGLLAPTSGSATPGDVSARELAARLAWVPQWSSAGIVASTVLDEAMATSRALGLPEAETRSRARSLLEHVGLEGLVSADPRQLSGGEQRRLAVVSALVHGPSAVLADEPTIGQDRHTWASVMGLLEAYRRAGGAVVVATHDPRIVSKANDVVRLGNYPATPMATRATPTTTETRAPTATPPTTATATPAPLSGAGPLSLLGAALLPIAAGVISPSWRDSLLILIVEGLSAVIGLGVGHGAWPRYRRAARRLVPGAIAAVGVAWSTWLLGGHDLDLASTGLTRILVIVVPSAVLVPFVDPDALGDQLAQRMRLPSRPVVAVSAALQRLHTLGDSWAEMTRARRVRGLSNRGLRGAAHALRAMTLGLLVRALSDAAALAVAMDARGFATAGRRTWFTSARWTTADTVVVLAGLVPVIVAIGLRGAAAA